MILESTTLLMEKNQGGLFSNPVVNEDGSVSTVRTISFEEDGKEILIPTVINGRIVSDEEAIEHYHRTGFNFGKFDTVEEANKAAEELHQREAKRLGL